jgi:hypothetical protein
LYLILVLLKAVGTGRFDRRKKVDVVAPSKVKSTSALIMERSEGSEGGVTQGANGGQGSEDGDGENADQGTEELEENIKPYVSAIR